MAERLFSIHQIADLLGTSQKAVKDWVDKGWMPFKRLPDGPIRIPEKGLVRFLKDRGIDLRAIMAEVAQREAEEPYDSQMPEAPSTDRRETVAEQEPQMGAAVSHALPKRSPPPSPAAEQQYPVAQVAEAILQDAVAKRATHIHLDPCRDGLTLRARIDGVLYEKGNFRERLPKPVAAGLIAHFKALGGMKTEKMPRLQTGLFDSSIEGREVGFRLAIWPTVQGEKLVIRVDDHAGDVLALSQLGLGETEQSRLRRLLREPCGIILIVGPPGNGRATTLQAMLGELSSPTLDIVVLETEEITRLEGVTRCRIGGEQGVTAAEALRASRLQDADVIAVEQIADRASAAAAVEAAADGRLVLGSLLGKGSMDALEMMLEASERWPLASTLLAVISQRTVRKLCPKCKEQTNPDPDLLAELNLQAAEVDFPVYRPGGCQECSQTGYAGRTGLFSVLHVDETIAAMLRKGADTGEIELAAVRARMKTLRQAKLDKLREGIASLEELARVLPARR